LTDAELRIGLDGVVGRAGRLLAHLREVRAREA